MMASIGAERDVPIRIAPAIVALMLAAGADAAEPSPWLGVYECWGPLHADGTGRPEREIAFALLDDAVYADRDGARGRYEIANGVLAMMSGPLSGTRYRQTAGLTFSLIGATADGPAICSYSPGKDARAAGW
jgi:hypothetical protein